MLDVKPKILIAEDDQNLAEALAQICIDKGCEARTAKDGREAFDILKQESFTLLITDVRMPHMDGLCLMKSLKSAGIDVPVIVMSGFSDYTAEDVDGCDGIVLMEKPFTRKQVEEIVDQYITLLV